MLSVGMHGTKRSRQVLERSTYACFMPALVKPNINRSWHAKICWVLIYYIWKMELLQNQEARCPPSLYPFLFPLIFNFAEKIIKKLAIFFGFVLLSLLRKKQFP